MTYAKPKMKHRIAAAFFAAMLMASVPVIPAAAAAVNNTFTFSNSGIAVSGSGTGCEIDGTDLKITDSGTYTVTGSASEGTITIKKELTDVTLILAGLTLSASETAPITINKASEVTIQVKDTNVITDNEDIDEESTSETFEGAGIKVKSGSTLALTGSGTLTVNGNCKNGIKGAAEASVTVDGPTLNITAANDALSADASVTVKSGTLNLTAAGDGIQASPDTDDTVSAGTVTVTGGTFAIKAQGDGIQGEGDVNIKAGTFDIVTGGGYQATLADDASAKGIKSAADVNLTGGTYAIDSADDALHAKGDLSVKGGTYTIASADDALHADYTLNVGIKAGTGPKITVTSSVEGLEGAVVNLYAGNGNIASSDDGVNAANSELTGYDFAINIYDGTWNIDAQGDGLDSNRDINMYGGEIEAFGAANAGNSAFDYDGTATYEGGTLLAVGMSGMAQGFSSGTYVAFGNTSRMGGGAPGGRGGMPGNANNTAAGEEQGFSGGQGGTPSERPNAGEGFDNRDGTPPDRNDSATGMPQGDSQKAADASAFTIAKGSSIVIKDSAGNTLYTATGLRTANSVIFAEDDLVSGQTYTLYIDGTEVATATAVSGASGGNQGGGSSDSVLPFRDISSGSWYYSSVRTVYEEKIMTGTSDTAFNPDGSLTRAMLAQILYNLSGSPKTDTDAGFADVSTDAWYADAVNRAAEAGIISGYSDDKFGPNDTATREQMATFLYRYAAYKGYDTDKTADLSDYEDSGTISAYAQTAVKWANASGLITGTDQQQLLPLHNTTRAQTAAILERLSSAF